MRQLQFRMFFACGGVGVVGLIPWAMPGVSTGFLFGLPGSGDRSHEHETDERVAGVDEEYLEGAGFEDVLLCPAGGDEAHPDERGDEHSTPGGLGAGDLREDAEDNGSDDGAEELGDVLERGFDGRGRVDAVLVAVEYC